MSFRPPSRSNRPASGLRSTNRPSTGFRRLDTANGQKPIGSRTVGLDTNVQIENRPITQHGMTGMKTASRASNRKIADRNYYEHRLKEKLIEIVNETESMKQKIKMHNEDKIEIGKLEKERNNVMNEVREHEGKLADYNLALDKMRSGADIVHLQQATQEIQRRNEEEKMRIDAIFLERKNLETQITEIDHNISIIYDEMTQCVENNSKFDRLYTEYQRIDGLISEKEKRLNHIQHKYHDIRESLSSNQYAHHLKAIEIQKHLNDLNEHKIELEQETNGSCAMNSDQIKQKILEDVKKDNKILQKTMEDINEIDDKTEELQRIITQKEKDLNTMKDFIKESHKYQQLFDRDRKMQIFIDKFEDNSKNIKNEMNLLKKDNVGLLIHLSENNNDNVNKAETKMNEMKNDISFKKQQKNEAQNTLIYSEKELEKREMELEKINNLDKKISVELDKIDTKTSEFEEEIKSFKTYDEIQAEYKEKKQKLFQMKMGLQQKKESMEKKVLDIAQKSDQINRKLNENAYHNELKEMETKIAKLSQNIFAVEDSINEYKREGEYQPLLDNIIKMQNEINSLLLKEIAIES